MKHTVKILKPIIRYGIEFPVTSKIILDESLPIKNQIHQIVNQRGESYGQVGDYCEYLDNKDLRELSDKGFIEIKKV